MAIMSARTDHELILLIRNGDDEAFSVLLARYQYMLRKRVNRSFEHTDADEAYCEACEVFHAAALSYDMRAQVTFGLYAQICVERYLNRRLKKLADARERAAAAADVERLSVPGSAEAALIRSEELSALLSRIRALASDFEYAVFLSLYRRGNSLAETAEHLGKPQKSVENARDRLFRRLRKHPELFGSD